MVAFLGSKNRLLIATSIGYSTAFLGVAVVSPLLPAIIADFGLSSLQAGVAMAVLWGVYALSQYPGGRLSDTATRKSVLLVSLAALVLGCLLVILSPTYAALLAALAVLGLGSGIFPSVAIAVVFDAFTTRRGQALGILVAVGDAAGIVAAGLAVAAIAVASWTAAFGPVIGLVAVSVALTHAWNPDPYGVPRRVDLDLVATLRRVFGPPARRWEAVGFALWMFAFQAVVSFLPTYLDAAKGAGLGVASGGFALLWLVGIVVKPVAGRLGDRHGYLRVAVASVALAAVGLVGVVVSAGAVLIAVAVVGFAAGLLATTTNVYAHVTRVMPDASVGGDVGAIRTLLLGVGSLGPVYVGYSADAVGWDAAFLGLAACLGASAVILGSLGEFGGSGGD